ncbi:MAG: heavy metal translocating P-type ATPase [Armatimonadota bacterium]|jgi:Cd2+/Zn2+-exporting ATPase
MTTTEFEIAAFAPEISECAECLDRLIEAVRTAGGVTEAHLRDSRGFSVTFDPEMVSIHEIERTARALGIEVEGELHEATFTAEELCCADCAERVEHHLRRLPGVHAVSANFAAQVVEVTFHPRVITTKQLQGEVERIAGESHATTERHMTLRIEGMDCASCAETIGLAVERLDGVSSAQVSFTTASARVVYVPELITPDEIVETVRGLGYEALRADVLRERFIVAGIDCPDCATGIEGALLERRGITSAELSAATGRLVVDHDPAEVTAGEIIAIVEALGHEISSPEGPEPAAGWIERLRRRPRSIPTLLCAVFTATGLILGWAGANYLAAITALALAIVVGGYPIAKSALVALRTSLAADMNVLMTIAVIGAVVIGEWHEAATVVLLFSVANALESYTSDRTRNAIRSLMDLSPDTASVLRNGEEMTVAVESVAVGDEVVIRPGGRIPVDGTVTGGRSEVNQAPVTGESEPVEVEGGDEVFAGTVNGPGLLRVRASRAADDTTIARIIHMVEEAQAQRSPSQRFVDRFARWYTPIVIALAALTAAIPPLALGQEFEPWFYRALTLLVLACPCALVISTPVAIAAAIANGARNGVLVKGGVYIERMAAVRQFAVDKTGTLTLGRPEVTHLIPAEGYDECELLQVAAAAESGSEHALGEAIVRHAGARGLRWPRLSEFRAVTGRGVRASVNGATVHVGRPTWVSELGFDTAAIDDAIRRLEEQARTVVVVARENAKKAEVLGAIGIADRPREEAAGAIRSLRELGVRRLVMLTGDAEPVAAAIAAELSIDEYAAGLLPDEKVERVRRLRESGPVAMVGDGVNDAPAIALADVGIAMGAAGTDAALETADIALMSDDLSRLPFAVRLSRMALRIVKQNIVAALVLKLAFMALVAPGLLTLWLAILGDTGVSIAVTLNSMRLLRARPGRS